MDAKYGQIYTEGDLRKIAKQLLGGRAAGPDIFAEAMAALAGEFAFPADEPTFVLRAKDAAAAQSIVNTHRSGIDYYDHAQNVGASPATLEAIKEAANEMKHWQMQNRRRVKVPD